MLLTQQPRVRILAFLKIFRGKIIDDAEVNQQRWLEEKGQWLENVDRTRLVLKPVLKKLNQVLRVVKLITPLILKIKISPKLKKFMNALMLTLAIMDIF